MRELYTKAAAVAVPLVQGIRDDQLDGPTPCTEYTVRDLVNHLFQVVVEFQKSARLEDMDFATAPDYLNGGWRDRFAAEVEALAQAWSVPSALEGDNSQMGFPRPIVARLPVFDLTVHGWDLARSTGQSITVDAGLVDELYDMAVQFAEVARSTGEAPFDPPVEVAIDAPVVDKLVGIVGRDPAWKP